MEQGKVASELDIPINVLEITPTMRSLMGDFTSSWSISFIASDNEYNKVSLQMAVANYFKFACFFYLKF